MGVIQRNGAEGLVALSTNQHTTSGLTRALSLTIDNQWIS